MRFNIDDKFKNYSGIYIIKNTIDSRCYIGSTNDFYQRYKDHKSNLINNKHNNPHIQSFVNKYGIDSLAFNLLCFCNIEVLIYNEKLLIDELMPEFNIKPIEITDFNLYDAEFQKQKVFNFIDDMLNFNNTTEES